MKEEIEKLLLEYKFKIEDSRNQIENIGIIITNNRRNKKDNSFERKEQKKFFAQLNAYIQAESDIDSLLDYIKE